MNETKITIDKILKKLKQISSKNWELIKKVENLRNDTEGLRLREL